MKINFEGGIRHAWMIIVHEPFIDCRQKSCNKGYLQTQGYC